MNKSKSTHFLQLSRQERSKLLKRMSLGAAIGLSFISLFVFGVDTPKPEWGSLWQIRPLVVTSLAGAAGGFFVYAMEHVAVVRHWNRAVAYAIGFFVFIVGLWIGAILGLDGTLWN